MSITVRAAAKINLHLGVGRVRDDGFHPLDTVYQAISLHDDVTVAEADEDELSVAGASHLDLAGVPTDASNIAMRALAEVSCGRRHHVRIAKEIPVAGGMAGGSADGAAALLAHDRLHDLVQPDDVLLAQAARLGSDVPFSLVGGTARGRGRGEVVEPIEDHGTWWWVAVPSAVGLSTPEVYRHFDRLRPDAPERPAEPTDLLVALASGEPVRLARALHNDLQEPAIDLRPELGTLIERGEAEGALRGLVSGSGPTCVFLCDSRDGAMAVVAGLAATYDVVLPAVGPVAGAHVLA
ncbi:4-diphosphocytidyl-2C-methyl-D-erythritol kinase [Nocardioides sp. Root122]|uniref:4-(cytidine 5'-diphospho)-2-C-methyl-D-erythritol kinase n=1 Tax=Nocardioides TaxID=1839 RepID=UPI000702D8B3|nr:MULTISPECIES: 4-(cytidine 5'-diphospho)-2-C-methyl-D-erythritol kinase [Nocardioides]KQV77833.1 4-diphosphocytidyl-2C-methyl-D-erythritol kinase [Nocardioides sp. Root122]MCK9822314.1 4-(cytidine 5'-diphospho)-2-C-methyl-D-erythritol kinase [Nocardioides cavernae]